VISRFDYSDAYDPPAPILPLRLSHPSAEAGVMVVALLDTGADVTMMPRDVVRRLALPLVARTRVMGVGGETRADIHAARVEVAGTSQLLEVVALGDEAIIGRDMVARWVLQLDGPRGVLVLRTEQRRSRRS
jgi:predicted aspartyl protease